MWTQREVLAVERIEGAYDDVRHALLADPLGILQRATCTVLGGLFGAKLRAQFGPLEVASDIVVDLTAVEQSTDKPATRVSLEWGAMRWPEAFPTMRATLSLYPLGPTHTVIELHGSYEPPLGTVGEAANALALHRIAKECVVHFVQDVARLLELGATLEARPS